MNNSNTKVSVLVPVYNVEQFLPRCLDSILNQTMEDIEIICVNDASTDCSLDILNEYATRDSRIKIIDKSEHGGLMMTRKTAYSHARGDYFFFCDSNGYLPADSLENLYSRACASDADIIVGQVYIKNRKGRTSLRSRNGIAGKYGDQSLRAILNRTSCTLCGVLFIRDIFDNNEFEIYPEHSFCEDRLLLTQILLSASPSVTYINTPAYYWENTVVIKKIQTQESLSEHLTALFECHRMVAENGGKSLTYDNDAFIIRLMSRYLEIYPWRDMIKNFNETSARLLTFRNMVDTIGKKKALHTWNLIHIPGFYRVNRLIKDRFIQK